MSRSREAPDLALQAHAGVVVSAPKRLPDRDSRLHGSGSLAPAVVRHPPCIRRCPHSRNSPPALGRSHQQGNLRFDWGAHAEHAAGLALRDARAGQEPRLHAGGDADPGPGDRGQQRAVQFREPAAAAQAPHPGDRTGRLHRGTERPAGRRAAPPVACGLPRLPRARHELRGARRLHALERDAHGAGRARAADDGTRHGFASSGPGGCGPSWAAPSARPRIGPVARPWPC